MLSSSDVSAVWRSRVTGHTRFSGWCRPFLCPAVELHPPVEGLFLKISLETGTFSFSQLMFAPFFFSLSNDLCLHGDRSGFGTETMTFISLEWLLDTCAYSHRTCHTYQCSIGRVASSYFPTPAERWPRGDANRFQNRSGVIAKQATTSELQIFYGIFLHYINFAQLDLALLP